MKSYKFYYIILVLIILSFILVEEHVSVRKLVGKEIDNYDTAAFNYVYVEALKQKLMGNGGDALKYFEQCIKINPKSDACILSDGADRNCKRGY